MPESMQAPVTMVPNRSLFILLYDMLVEVFKHLHSREDKTMARLICKAFADAVLLSIQFRAHFSPRHAILQCIQKLAHHDIAREYVERISCSDAHGKAITH